jgi:single-strand DNA-binding protein
VITLPAVTIIGTLTADPELRYTQSGLAVANFTVASNERRKDPSTGEWVDGDATFLRCNIWKDHAENAVETLTKGTRVIVVGRLKQRSYETKEGDKRTVYELEVEDVGPSTRWATAKVSKVSRNGGERRPTRSMNDTMNTPQDDEPPF